MILDPEKLTVSAGKATWGPPPRLWKLIAAMSAKPGKVWRHTEMKRAVGSPASNEQHIGAYVRDIRSVFALLKWPDPIETRVGLGYAWTLPVTLAPAVNAPAAGADEFRFKRQ